MQSASCFIIWIIRSPPESLASMIYSTDVSRLAKFKLRFGVWLSFRPLPPDKIFLKKVMEQIQWVYLKLRLEIGVISWGVWQENRDGRKVNGRSLSLIVFLFYLVTWHSSIMNLWNDGCDVRGKNTYPARSTYERGPYLRALNLPLTRCRFPAVSSPNPATLNIPDALSKYIYPSQHWSWRPDFRCF
jgi:hypothetical protein